jgi:putative FmdB family regulatory protein
MPLYEYKCANCGKRFEKIQKFSDAPLTVHEECGSGPVERLISVSALQFKGSGWYVNDYAKNGGSAKESGSKEGKEGKEAKEAKEAKDSTKSDSSSESKTSESTTKTEPSKPATPAPSTSTSDK